MIDHCMWFHPLPHVQGFFWLQSAVHVTAIGPPINWKLLNFINEHCYGLMTILHAPEFFNGGNVVMAEAPPLISLDLNLSVL